MHVNDLWMTHNRGVPEDAELVVPDDIRDLADDIAAYRRELRHARRTRLARGPMFAMSVAVLLAGLIALMLTVMAPAAVDRPLPSLPLVHPAVADGTVHGLLPNVTLSGPNGQIDSRAAGLRPAVFALVPAGCNCRTLLDGLAGAAYSERLPLAVVVAAAGDPQTAGIVGSLDRGVSALYLDPTGTIAHAVIGSVPTSANGPSATVVVVDRDGAIYAIEPDVTDPRTSPLDAALQSMLASQ